MKKRVSVLFSYCYRPFLNCLRCEPKSFYTNLRMLTLHFVGEEALLQQSAVMNQTIREVYTVSLYEHILYPKFHRTLCYRVHQE